MDRNSPRSPFTKRGFQRCLLSAFVLVICVPGVFASGNIDPAAMDTITGQISAENGFVWRYGYDISSDGHSVMVRVAVKLIPHAGVTQLDLDRVKPEWEAGIEGIWSNHYALKTLDGRRYPILVDVAFNGPRFHHQVIVRPGGGRSDELNWNIMNPPALAAHEFGHMLGVFDEYRPGATDPNGKIIDATSIMTSNVSNGKTYERHYQRIWAWFKEKNGLNGVELVSIDADPHRAAKRSAPYMKKE